MTELKTTIEKYQDVEFWRDLCPGLSITEDKSLGAHSSYGKNKSIRAGDWEQCKDLINNEGYFAYESWFDPELIDRLAECLRQLEKHEILPAFCFVYDEFWELMLRLDPLLSDLLGEYWLLPAVWAWHVKPENQTAFTPHRDQVREAAIDDDDHLDYLTIWIPLTDLNHLSSCICVLPASADPDYDSGTDRVAVENLQDIRTLQGKRGSVFCWTTGLVHWGTKQSQQGTPRISVGLYVQNPEAECFDPPPMDFTNPFSLQQRISLVGQQIIDYARGANNDLLRLASSLIELSGES